MSNIENPFCVKVSGVNQKYAFSLNPKSTIGNTEFTDLVELGKDNSIIVNHLDDKLSYMFGKKPITEVETSNIECYDYQIPAEQINKTAKVKHKEGLPISFIQIDNIEDGILWYKKHYPKVPDELLPIIARYHWGEPFTKKGIKNEKKKLRKKKNQDKLFKVQKGEFKITWD